MDIYFSLESLFSHLYTFEKCILESRSRYMMTIIIIVKILLPSLTSLIIVSLGRLIEISMNEFRSPHGARKSQERTLESGNYDYISRFVLNLQG